MRTTHAARQAVWAAQERPPDLFDAQVKRAGLANPGERNPLLPVWLHCHVRDRAGNFSAPCDCHYPAVVAAATFYRGGGYQVAENRDRIAKPFGRARVAYR
jgi:hypothetical protein